MHNQNRTNDLDPAVQRIVDMYQEEQRKGLTPEVEDFVRAHPEIDQQVLREELETYEQMRRLFTTYEAHQAERVAEEMPQAQIDAAYEKFLQKTARLPIHTQLARLVTPVFQPRIWGPALATLAVVLLLFNFSQWNQLRQVSDDLARQKQAFGHLQTDHDALRGQVTTLEADLAAEREKNRMHQMSTRAKDAVVALLMGHSPRDNWLVASRSRSIGNGQRLPLLRPVGTAIDSTEPTLEWETVDDISSYFVSIYDYDGDRAKKEVWPEREIDGTQVAVDPGVLVAGKYYKWYVSTEKELGGQWAGAVFRVIGYSASSEVKLAEARFETSVPDLVGIYLSHDLYDKAIDKLEGAIAQDADQPAIELLKALLEKVRDLKKG